VNIAHPGPWPTIADYDAMLMDVARRIQLTKTKHELAETNFRALCDYVDREGSPLENKVIECYPSGSFATGTAIASRVAKDQHDVDVVMEIDVPANTAPSVMLGASSRRLTANRAAGTMGKSRRTAGALPLSMVTGPPLT
jgi:hypothetical protein